MKKYISFILAASAVMTLAGCNKADNLQPEQPALVNTPLTLTASMDEGTKTTLVNNKEVYWEETDTFYGFINNGEQVLTFVFDGLVSENPKCANFICNEPHYAIQAGDALTCVYGCTLSANNLPVWPEHQYATTSGIAIDGTRNISAVPMFAYGVAKSDATFDDVQFKNGGGLMQVNVTNNTATDISPDMLYIDSPEAKICGEFNLPSFDVDGNPSVEFTTNASKTLAWKFNVADKVVAKNTQVSFNVAVPAATYSKLKFVYTGEFGTIPYGFIRNMKDGASITVHRSQIDQISMNLYKELPIGPDSPVGTIGGFTDLQDPHHSGGRTGMIVGFDFSSGTGLPASKLVICTANLVLKGKTEDDGAEAAWNKGSLVKYNETNSHTAGGHWRLMTKAEAETVIETDEHGTGEAQWGTLEGVQGIYWYFDPARYAEYNANVVPNSIFLPVTHTNAAEGGRAEGRYWLDGDYYFEFWQDPSNPQKGIVNVVYDKDLSTSDHLGAIRLVHTMSGNDPTL